ncbi:histidine kinase [Oleiharenicola lentus]|uniref:histidine kinase n=1 Tax=Oleiharenicola lentus TaxID=2508720 RepID=UPI003F662730
MPINPPARAVAIHPRGFVYVASIDGLAEYDGATWQRVAGTEGLIVHNVAVTPQGHVYYSGAETFGHLVRNGQGALQAQPLQTQLATADRRVGHVLRIALAGESAVFAPQGAEHFLVRAQPNGTVEKIPLTGRCTSLFAHAGAVFFTVGTELWRVEANSAPARVATLPQLRSIAVVATHTTAGGEALLICSDGLHRWDRDEAPLLSKDIVTLLAGDRITSCAALEDGTLLLGTDAHGLLIVDTEGRVLAHYTENDRNFPISGKIAALTGDTWSGVWISHYGGVTRAQFNSPTSLHDIAGGFARVESFAFHHGQLHVGTTRGVMVRGSDDGQFKLLPQGGIDTWALLSTKDGLVVAGDDLRLIRPDGSVQLIEEQRLGFRSAIFLRRDPNCLLASTGPGGQLRVYRRQRSQAGEITWRFEGLVASVRAPLYPLVEDDAGWIWSSRNRLEIVRLDWRKGMRLDTPLENLGAEHGLTGAGAASFRVRLFLLNGQIEVSSQDQLWRFDPIVNRFVAEDRIAGGFDAKRWSRAFPLSDGSLWLANSQDNDPPALARATTPNAWRFEPLTGTDLESLRPTALIDDPATGTLWLGHLGLAAFDLRWKTRDTSPPSVVIREIASRNGKSLWRGSNDETRQLSFEDTSLGFTYAAPYFHSDTLGRTKISYRTQLQGVDAGWSDWSEHTQRDYSNLPSGNFSFRVQARDASGNSGPVSQLRFTLPTLWWRTSWAVVAYFVFGLLSIASLIHLRTRALQARAARLTATVAEHTAELLQQNRELKRLHQLELNQKSAALLAEEKARLETLRYQLNPHFLFNTLTSISASLPENATATRTMVRRLADFCRITLHRGEDTERSNVGEEMRQLRTYLEIEQSRWGDLLEVTIDCPPMLELEPLPHFLLLPLVENAIKYGRATSQDRIIVRLSVRREPEELVLVVANSGEWIETDAARRGTPSFGIGLANLRERLARYYPRAHELIFSHTPGWVSVTLHLKIFHHDFPSPHSAHPHH